MELRHAVRVVRLVLRQRLVECRRRPRRSPLLQTFVRGGLGETSPTEEKYDIMTYFYNKNVKPFLSIKQARRNVSDNPK